MRSETRDHRELAGACAADRDLLESVRRAGQGWLKRIEKGKYLIVPLEAGPDRTWSEDAHVIAEHLVSPSMVAYWSALNYWNLTEQVPRITYVQTTARKKNRRPTVLGMKFRIVRVKPETHRRPSDVAERSSRTETTVPIHHGPTL